jgi:hypothetical protein
MLIFVWLIAWVSIYRFVLCCVVLCCCRIDTIECTGDADIIILSSRGLLFFSSYLLVIMLPLLVVAAVTGMDTDFGDGDKYPLKVGEDASLIIHPLHSPNFLSSPRIIYVTIFNYIAPRDKVQTPPIDSYQGMAIQHLMCKTYNVSRIVIFATNDNFGVKTAMESGDGTFCQINKVGP